MPYGNSNWSYSPEMAKWGHDLCDLDLWPWPFAWTSHLSLVITPENFMKIWWWEHSEEGVTDGQTDERTDRSVLRAAWSQLKSKLGLFLWQIGPNLSSGIRWCLALASVRPQWCLLWHFDVYACVCGRVNGGPDLIYMMEACLICVICVIVVAEKPWDLSTVTHQWCLQYLPQLCAVAWSESCFGDVSF